MSKKSIALVGESLPFEQRTALEAFGFRLIPLPFCPALGANVRSHTDLLVFPLDNKLFTYGGVYEELLADTGYDIVTVKEEPKEKYPHDIYLNALTVGKYIFARLPYLSGAIREYAEGKGYTLIDVKQGYARCTACPISERAIITADSSIANAAEGVGIDVLRISSGAVRLDGYDYGFIGGACGVAEENVFFTGDILSHPDGLTIEDFCLRHGKRPISLSKETLCDVGSIFFI